MKLSEYLKKTNKKPADLARAFGVVHCMARRWCNGEAKPAEKYMQKIIAYTNGLVTPNDFYEMGEANTNEQQSSQESEE